MFISSKKISCFVSILACVSTVAQAKDKKSSVVKQLADVTWEEFAPGAPLKAGKLWGDKNKGAYGLFLKMPGGFEAGMHAHTADYHAVLISGTWLHWDEGTESSIELGAGSYVFQPGKANHNDKCKEGADCVILLVQNKKNDFIPAKK